MYGIYTSLKVLSHNLSQESPLQQHSHTPFQFYYYLYFFFYKRGLFIYLSQPDWGSILFIKKM